VKGARLSPGRLLALLAIVFTLVAGSAMLRTSTTFDEIVFPAVGARGLVTGDFGMVRDHPRLPQYLYGLPLYLSGVRYPPEEGYDWRAYSRFPSARYHYAQALYWGAGNSPERVAMTARLVGLAFGVLLVLATFFAARRHMGDGAALVAAGLVALLPDVLAHSGVAYTDVPLAFAMLVGIYTLDAMAREPTPRRAAVAGVAFAFAACIKFSALALVAVGFLLLALEASAGRWRDTAWRSALVRAGLTFAVAAYAVFLLVYPFDWRLGEYVDAIGDMAGSMQFGRASFLLGESRLGGWWYFFPVAFFLKTPAGLHALGVIALVAAFLAAREGAWRTWASHGARAPAVGAAVLLAAVVSTRINIGMRHALPLLPLLMILVAQGIEWAWLRGAKVMRAAIALCLVAFAASTLRVYPWFLSYVSEYAAGRPLYATLVDSSTDWGQGLVALGDYMRANGIDRVALGYFGSAPPLGYGVEYAALPSYFDLPPARGDASAARYVVVSATLLAGSYLEGDPYAALRREKPVAVVGGSLYVFDRQALRH
jgi:hypothetical protein